MSWKVLVFGNPDPGPRRIAGFSALYVALAFAMHGLATQFLLTSFLPAPIFLDPPAWLAFSALGAVPAAGLFFMLPPRPGVERHSARHALLALLCVPLFGFLAWLAIAGSLAAIYTRMAGTAYSETVTLRPEHRISRRGCNHRALDVRIDGRHRETVCLPSALYDAYPDRNVRTRIIGRRSALGFAIDAYEFDDAGP